MRVDSGHDFEMLISHEGWIFSETGHASGWARVDRSTMGSLEQAPMTLSGLATRLVLDTSQRTDQY